MISMYFGVPGVGKTTLLAKIALQNLNRYKYIYTNVRLRIPGVIYITDDCIGTYDLHDYPQK